MNPVSNGFGGPAPRPPGIYWDVINEAWRIVTADLGTWMVATLLMYVVTYGVNIVTSLIGMLIDPNSSPFSGARAIGKTPEFGPTFFLTFGLQMLGGLLVYPMQAGLFLMAVRRVRGEQVAIGDVFAGYKRTGPVIGAYLLMGIAIGLGTLLCIIPGFYVAGALAFVPILVLDQELDVMQTLETSYNALKSHAWSMFGLLFVLGLVTLLGFCACGVGILVSFPVYVMALALTYYNFFPNRPGTGWVQQQPIGIEPPL